MRKFVSPNREAARCTALLVEPGDAQRRSGVEWTYRTPAKLRQLRRSVIVRDSAFGHVAAPSVRPRLQEVTQEIVPDDGGAPLTIACPVEDRYPRFPPRPTPRHLRTPPATRIPHLTDTLAIALSTPWPRPANCSLAHARMMRAWVVCSSGAPITHVKTTAGLDASHDEWTELRSSCDACGLPFCVKKSSECGSALCSDCEQSQETTSHSSDDDEFDPLGDLLTAGRSGRTHCSRWLRCGYSQAFRAVTLTCTAPCAATQERCKRQSRACKGKDSKRHCIDRGPPESVEITSVCQRLFVARASRPPSHASAVGESVPSRHPREATAEQAGHLPAHEHTPLEEAQAAQEAHAIGVV
jgi:hypothetical protein